MNEEQVATILANDIKTNFVWFQFGAVIIGCALIVIGAFLAARAYAALSEARILFTQAKDIELAVLQGVGRRRSTPENIAMTSRAKKVRQAGKTLP